MSDAPQFGTAEYQPEAGSHHCKTCGQTITGQYFRISSAMTCPGCAENMAGRLPKSPRGAFTRGLLFASGGAIVGLILYSAVGIITGLEIGYVSVAVGYIVGRAMLAGTAGVGGRRHQIAAALLTYAAVSMSAVPISLWQFAHEEVVASAAVEEPVTAQPEEVSFESVESTEPGSASGGLFGAFFFLSMVGLMSPFLGLAQPLSGLIGLIILFVGIRIAWTMTAGNGVEVTGPYHC
jgi:hypothetical protein